MGGRRGAAAAAALLWWGATAAQADGGVADIEAELRVQPAREVLQRHFGCEPPHGAGHALVAAGGAEALALAVRLLAGSDACHTAALQSALGEAMRRAPREVLALVDRSPELAAERICLPFLPAELPPAQLRRQLRLSRRALLRVEEPALARPRAACLDLIERLAREAARQR